MRLVVVSLRMICCGGAWGCCYLWIVSLKGCLPAEGGEIAQCSHWTLDQVMVAAPSWSEHQIDSELAAMVSPVRTPLSSDPFNAPRPRQRPKTRTKQLGQCWFPPRTWNSCLNSTSGQNEEPS